MKRSAIAVIFLCLVTVCLVMIAGCSKKAATGGQTATLALKDGTTVSGTVTKSDTSSITLQTPAGVVSTYPLSQVASVNYGPGPGAAAQPAAVPAPAPPQQAAGNTPPPPPADPNATAPASASANAGAAEAAPAPEHEYVPAATYQTIPAGTTIEVRTNQTIDSRTASEGETYSGVIAHAVRDADGRVAIPRGAEATLVIRQARAQGRVQGRSELALDVGAVRVSGREYRLETSDFVERGKEGLGTNKRTAKFAGGVGLLGGIIGAVAGGGRGAAIGAASGAAAGVGAQALTRGKDVRVPAETVLNFRLESDIRIRELH